MPAVHIGSLTLESVRASFVLPLICFVVVAVYGLAIHWMDSRRRARIAGMA